MRQILTILLLTIFPMTAFATKPCPMPACRDLASCEAIADWIVDGEIDDVEHDYVPPLVDKDFATFTLESLQWMKQPATGAAPDSIDFKVGWCDNSKSLPEDTSGRFRFYGKGAPDAEKPQYLYFEPVK